MKTDELWSLYRESNYIAYSVILAAVPDLMRLLGELTTLFLFRKKKSLERISWTLNYSPTISDNEDILIKSNSYHQSINSVSTHPEFIDVYESHKIFLHH